MRLKRTGWMAGLVLLAIAAGAAGPALWAQTTVFIQNKFLARSTAADSVKTLGGITAGSGAVAIVDTTGKIPALSSIYLASLDGSALTALNATQLTTGTVADARLSSNVPLLNAANTFTTNQTIGGLLSATGFGTHSFNGGGTGINSLRVRNTTAGTGNRGAIYVGHDTDDGVGAFEALSTTYTTSGPRVADGVALVGTRAGGLSVAATNAAGDVRFYAGGNTHRGTMVDDGTLDWFGKVQLGQAGSTNAYLNAAHSMIFSIDSDASGAGDAFIWQNNTTGDGTALMTLTEAGVLSVTGTTLRLGTSAVAGRVLTTDASGNGTWQDSGVASGSVPAGLIAIFDAACPVTWTRVTAFDGRFLRGGATYVAAGGGSDTHGHDVIGSTAGAGGHSHGGTTGNNGAHTHTVNTASDSAGTGDTGNFPTGTTSSNGDHNHTITSESNHTHTMDFDTSATSNVPLYSQVLFCKKD